MADLITIGTKVTRDSYKTLQRIARKNGLDIYGLLQCMVHSFIKLTDDHHSLDPQLEKLIDTFDHLEGWNKLTSIVSVSKKEIVESLYFVCEPNKHGTFAVLVRPGFLDSTFNAQEILDETLKATSPHLRKRLTAIGKSFDSNSHMETLLTLCDMFERDPDEDTIREMFADCGRNEYGRSTELKKYVPHNRQSISSYEQRQRLQTADLFDKMAEAGAKDEA